MEVCGRRRQRQSPFRIPIQVMWGWVRAQGQSHRSTQGRGEQNADVDGDLLMRCRAV